MEDVQFLVVVRHPESEANAGLKTTADGLYYSLCGSDMMVPQTAKGRRQARRLAKRLALMFPPERKLSHVYYSDFLRVRQTLAPINRQLGYDVAQTFDERLRKRSYGEFWNLTHAGVEALHRDEWQRYVDLGERRDLHYRAPGGGENYFDVFARVEEFIDNVVMPSDGNMLVLTHSVVALAFRRRLEGMGEHEVVRHYEAQTLRNAQILAYSRTGHDSPWQPHRFSRRGRRRTSAQAA